MESCFQDGVRFVSFFKGSAGPSALSLLPTTQHRLPQGSVLDSDMSVPHPFHTVSGRRQKGEGETSGAPLCSADAGLCCTQTEVPSAKTATLDGPRPEIPWAVWCCELGEVLCWVTPAPLETGGPCPCRVGQGEGLPGAKHGFCRLLIYFLLFWHAAVACGGLSSLTRDCTCAPYSGAEGNCSVSKLFWNSLCVCVCVCL